MTTQTQTFHNVFSMYSSTKYDSWMADPHHLFLVGHDGEGNLDGVAEFAAQGNTGVLLGMGMNGFLFVGPIAIHSMGVMPGARYGPFYGTSGKETMGLCVQLNSVRSKFQPEEVWWFSTDPCKQGVVPPKVAAAPGTGQVATAGGADHGHVVQSTSSPLAQRLCFVAHFPADELEILPSSVPTSVNGGNQLVIGPTCTTVEEIVCTTSNCGCLVTYCSSVPVHLRSLKRVVLSQSTMSSPSVSAVDYLKEIFTGGQGAAAHTLVLKGASNELACQVVEARMPGLACLVLDNCPEVSFSDFLPRVAVNPYLEELPFNKSQKVDGDIFELVRQCPHIRFASKPDLSALPPKVAAALSSTKPLQPPIPKEEFVDGTSNSKEIVGLVTAYGQVVLLERSAVPKLRLLEDMLAKSEDGDENYLIPMEMEPPVSKESVALAVHFVTHHVSDAVHTECAAQEEARRGHVATGQAASTYSWCQDFDQFRTSHITQRYSTANRRVQVLCELMALGAFFDCPSLKRFVRAALVMESFQQLQ